MKYDRLSRAAPALAVIALLTLPTALWLLSPGCISALHEIAALVQGVAGILITFLLNGLNNGLGTALVVLFAIVVLLSFVGVITVRLWERGAVGRVMLAALLLFNAVAGMAFWPLVLGGFPAC